MWAQNFQRDLNGDEKKNAAISPIVAKTVDFVRQALSGNDGSHDWFHIQRVWRLAKRLAIEEGVEHLEEVELAALLHDIDDWKYSGSETAGLDAARDFLQQQSVETCKIEFVLKIIKGVGFKDELNAMNTTRTEIFPELACVQDADRLDAIGAIGIARCFTYGGHKNRPLYDPESAPNCNLTKEEYMNAKNSPSVNHFYEKLFKLAELMKTETGKKIAAQRHEMMQGFLKQMFAEIRGEI